MNAVVTYGSACVFEHNVIHYPHTQQQLHRRMMATEPSHHPEAASKPFKNEKDQRKNTNLINHPEAIHPHVTLDGLNSSTSTNLRQFALTPAGSLPSPHTSGLSLSSPHPCCLPTRMLACLPRYQAQLSCMQQCHTHPGWSPHQSRSEHRREVPEHGKINSA